MIRRIASSLTLLVLVGIASCAARPLVPPCLPGPQSVSCGVAGTLQIQAAPNGFSFAKQNVPYFSSIFVTGGTPCAGNTYNWSIASGTPPAGIAAPNIQATGFPFSGTPTGTGSSAFTVKVTDCGGQMAQTTTQFESINVATLTSIAVTPSTSISQSTTQQMTAVGSWNDGTTNVLTQLATWASSNSASVTISNVAGSQGLASGTTTNGNSNITASFNSITSPAAVLTVTGGTPPSNVVINQTSLPNAQINRVYQQQLTATGGTPPYSFAVTAGMPPGGITVSSAGSVSGTATGTTATFSVTATDSASHSSSAQSFTLTVATLSSIAVTAPTSTIVQGATVQLTSTGTYSDSSQANITNLGLAGGGGSITVLQRAANQATGQVLTATFANPTTAGSTIVWACTQHTNNSTTITASDSASQSYTQISTDNTGYDAFNLQNMWIKWNSASITTGTCTTTAAASNMTIWGIEIANTVISGSPVDTSGKNACPSSCGTSSTSASITTTNANDLLLYCVNVITAETFSAGQGFTIPTANGSTTWTACEEQIVSAIQTTFSAQMSWNIGSAQFGGIVAAIEQVAGVTGTGWSTSSCTAAGAAVGSVNGTGLFSGSVPGTCVIQAAVGAVNGNITITVTGSAQNPITVTPANPNVSPGAQIQFHATQNNQDITAIATWASSNKNAFTIATGGLATAIGSPACLASPPCQSNITASH